MQAIWLDKCILSNRPDVPIPQAGPGEARVRVQLAGVCATDLELQRGYYPFTGVPGHEFVGEIVHAPDEPQREGQRVVGEINLVCGACAACQAGRSTHCENRQTLGIAGRNGAFAEFLTLPLVNLHPVADNIPNESAVFTEPLAAALEILEQVHIPPSARVLLVGAGRLGQLIAQVLALTGCDLQVVARHERQQALLHARHIPTVTEEQVPTGQFDLVVDAAGSPGGFRLARRAVRPRGSIVLKSTYQGNMEVNFSSIVVDEVQLVGSRCGPLTPALRLLASGRVDPTPLIEEILPLSNGELAFECAKAPGALIFLIQP
ncbi:MAG TPA: alcohol dehydrogenase catalytic domain-containing protein [Anaerolineales bacterium]|nr:alcohol dehydrogenase catalytic domain-containing protein [Anaerolineales bacterium]